VIVTGPGASVNRCTLREASTRAGWVRRPSVTRWTGRPPSARLGRDPCGICH